MRNLMAVRILVLICNYWASAIEGFYKPDDDDELSINFVLSLEAS